jgi:DNA-binding SARP family transcriptional activator
MESSAAYLLGAAGAPRLALLNGFQLSCNGRMIRLPLNSQRLLAFLALNGRNLARSYVAGLLWPESSDERAGASLRTTLWRVQRARLRLTESAGGTLGLAPAVMVDVHEMERVASALLAPSGGRLPEPGPLLQSGELLPGFYEEWVLMERERLNQLRLHALEALCRRFTSMGRYGDAVAAGIAAVAAEPLRESAQAVLIEAHLAEGNMSEAIRQYQRYRRVLREELNLEPSPGLRRQLRLLPAS